jgi:hypothetical protein
MIYTIFALTSVETAGLSLLVVIIIGVALGYWLFDFIGRTIGRARHRSQPPSRVRPAPKPPPRPLPKSSDFYEAFSAAETPLQLAGGGTVAAASPEVPVDPDPPRSSSGRMFFYTAFSWFFSIVMSVGLIALVGTLFNKFLNDADTGIVEVLALILLIGVWVWNWRRRHAPLLRLVPKRESSDYGVTGR